jgi:hypothetical protein
MPQQFLRTFIANSPFAPWALSIKVHADTSSWKCNIDISTWRRKGCPDPPPFGHKRQVIRDYAERYKLRTMVETGTYLGHMCRASHSMFSRIMTVELDPELHAAARKRLAPYSNVECFLGDSSKILPELLLGIHEPSLFWLDAHYSAGRTAKGDVETPISAELDAVLSHEIRNHVVLIDDARGFNGTHDYPGIDNLENSVRTLRPDLAFAVEHDIIRIAP